MAPSRLVSPPTGPVEAPIGKCSPSVCCKPAPDDIYGSYHPVNPDTLNLESNFGPMEPGSVGFLQPTSADTPLATMHERFERDGYLFVGQSDSTHVEIYSLKSFSLGERMYS